MLQQPDLLAVVEKSRTRGIGVNEFTEGGNNHDPFLLTSTMTYQTLLDPQDSIFSSESFFKSVFRKSERQAMRRADGRVESPEVGHFCFAEPYLRSGGLGHGSATSGATA